MFQDDADLFEDDNDENILSAEDEEQDINMEGDSGDGDTDDDTDDDYALDDDDAVVHGMEGALSDNEHYDDNDDENYYPDPK